MTAPLPTTRDLGDLSPSTTAGVIRAHRTPPLPASIRAVLDAVEDRVTAYPTVPDMARAAGYSRREFSRKVRASTGLSAEEHLIAARLSQAKRLLAHTDLPTEAVAVRVGYRSAAGLHNLLVREAGTTPTAYRERVRP